MKQQSMFLGAIIAMTLFLGPTAYAQDGEDGDVVGESSEEAQVLALAEVPPEVLATVRSVAPDVFFTGAQSYWEDDFRVYRITGRLFREVWNVYVRSDGKLIRTEADNQDR